MNWLSSTSTTSPAKIDIQTLIFPDTTVIVDDSYVDEKSLDLHQLSFGPHKTLKDLKDWWHTQKSKDTMDYHGHLDQVRRIRESLMKLDFLNEPQENDQVVKAKSGGPGPPDQVREVANQLAQNVGTVGPQEREERIAENSSVPRPRSQTFLRQTRQERIVELDKSKSSEQNFPEKPISERASQAIEITDEDPDQTADCLQRLIDESVHNMTWATKVLYKYRSIQQTKHELDTFDLPRDDVTPISLRPIEFRNINSQPILPSQRAPVESPRNPTSFSISTFPYSSHSTQTAPRPLTPNRPNELIIEPLRLVQSSRSWMDQVISIPHGGLPVKVTHGDGFPLAEKVFSSELLQPVVLVQERREAGRNDQRKEGQPTPCNSDESLRSAASRMGELGRRVREPVSRSSQTDAGRVVEANRRPQMYRRPDCDSLSSVDAHDTITSSAHTCCHHRSGRDTLTPNSARQSVAASTTTTRPLSRTDILLQNLLSYNPRRHSPDVSRQPSESPMSSSYGHGGRNSNFDRLFTPRSEDIHITAERDGDFWTDIIVAPPAPQSPEDPNYTATVVDFLQKQTAKSAAVLSEQLNKLSVYLANQGGVEPPPPIVAVKPEIITFPVAPLRVAESTSIFGSSEGAAYDGYNARTIGLFWSPSMRLLGEERKRPAGVYSKLRQIEKTCQKIIDCDNVASSRLQPNILSIEVVQRLAQEGNCVQLWPQISPVNFDGIRLMVVLPKQGEGDGISVSENGLREGLCQLRSIVKLRDEEICILMARKGRVI